MVPTPISNFRFAAEDKARWQACAEAEGLTLTAAIETAMTDWCSRVERRQRRSRKT